MTGGCANNSRHRNRRCQNCSMNNLLGHHNDVVDAVFARLEAIKKGDTDIPRVLVLTGESGIGKSRIVREVYEELCRRQPAPAYWPSLSPAAGQDKNSTPADPLAYRKVLGPDPTSFEWPSGALPSFGWWHFECEIMESQNAVNVVGTAYPQLRAHLPALGMAWNDHAGVSDKLGRMRDKVIEEVRSTAMDGGFEALGKLGLVFPGMGTLVRWAGHAGGKFVNDYQQRKQLHSDVTPASEAHLSAAKELAEAIRSTASPGDPGLPQIVVIEDMHRMGDDLAALLTELSQPDAKRPVLIIGTVWPEGFKNPGYKKWADLALEQRLAETILVQQLGQNDLVTLLRQYAKNTNVDIARQVVERMPNPYFLKQWLTTRLTQRRIAANNQALVLGPGDLKALPRNITEVLEQRWRELPDEVQQALIHAVAARRQVPSSDDAGLTLLPRFLPDVVSKAAEAVHGTLGPTADELAEGFKAAVSPGAWCNSDSDSQWLREVDLQDLVLSYALDESDGLAPDELVNLRRETRAVLIEMIDKRRKGIELQLAPDEMVAAEWLVSLPPVGEAEWTEADTAAQWALANTAEWNYDLATAIDRARIVLDKGRLDSGTNQRVRKDLARWVGASGRYAEAVELYRSLLEAELQTLSADSPAVLATRHHLALNLFHAGREAEALTEGQLVLADRQKVLGEEHRDTLVTLHNVACWLGAVGRLDEAVERLQELLATESRTLGSDDPSTLLTRRSLTDYRQKGGFATTSETIKGYQDVLLGLAGVLGTNHEETLKTRNSLAYTHGETGNWNLAIEQLEVLTQDTIQALGATHPTTMVARGNLARFLGDTGQVTDALEQLQAIVADEKALGSEENPDTLIWKANLARALHRAGFKGEAAEQYRHVLAGTVRIFGPTDTLTLQRMDYFGCYLAWAGNVQEATEYFRRALVERTRLLGPEHPDTERTRKNLENCLKL